MFSDQERKRSLPGEAWRRLSSQQHILTGARWGFWTRCNAVTLNRQRNHHRLCLERDTDGALAVPEVLGTAVPWACKTTLQMPALLRLPQADPLHPAVQSCQHTPSRGLRNSGDAEQNTGRFSTSEETKSFSSFFIKKKPHRCYSIYFSLLYYFIIF